MTLPLTSPYPPMEARAVAAVPAGPEWQYEPKWDGFRCLVFRDGDDVTLQSKSGQPLTRYFPELVAAIRAVRAKAFALDGEIAVPDGPAFSFDALLQRIHPAASRVARLAKETPAIFVVFDLLAEGKHALVDEPLATRRKALERFATAQFHGETIRLSPATTKLAEAKDWLANVGSTLDGLIAKRVDQPYRSGERAGMEKIKTLRTIDCVVGGFRYGEGKKVVGSLLLGLYDDEGLLHHVGFTSSIKASERAALTAKLERLVGGPGFTGKAPGGPSRWSSKRSAEWQALKAKLVVEVCYDHFTGGRFRHGTKLLRFRPDKAPRQCTMDQLAQPRGNLLGLLR